MSHDILGELRPDPRIPNALTGSIEAGGTAIPLTIEFDGTGKDLVLQFASDIVSGIDHFVLLASKCAAEDLLDTYNENWRLYSVADGKGGFVDVTDPELTAEAFSSKLVLSRVTICGDTMCELWFADGGMFAGHSVSVSSSDGTKFEKLNASLFG